MEMDNLSITSRSTENDTAALAANTKLSSSWPHRKPESLHSQESLSWRKLALNGYLSSFQEKK